MENKDLVRTLSELLEVTDMLARNGPLQITPKGHAAIEPAMDAARLALAFCDNTQGDADPATNVKCFMRMLHDLRGEILIPWVSPMRHFFLSGGGSPMPVVKEAALKGWIIITGHEDLGQSISWTKQGQTEVETWG